MKVVTVFEYDELVKLQSAVVVEMWNSVLSTGKGRKKFNATFTELEQATIASYYKIFYTWYRVTGVPQKHQMTVRTYGLMQRVCDFFGTY